MRTLARLAVATAVLLFSREALAGDTLGKTPVYTKSATDFQTEFIGADGTTKGNIQGNNTAPGSGGGVQVLTLDSESSAPTCTAGRFCMPWGDLGGRLHIISDLNLPTNMVQIAGAAPSATNPLWMVLSDGAAAYTGAKSIQFPASLGQKTMANSVGVTLASDQPAIPVTQGAPSGVIFGTSTATSLTGTSLVTPVCKGSLAISTITKIETISVTSFNSARCICQYNDNGSKTVIANLATSPADPTASMIFTSAKPNLTTSATATTQQVECACTGADANQTASDITCTVTGCQSNSGC